MSRTQVRHRQAVEEPRTMTSASELQPTRPTECLVNAEYRLTLLWRTFADDDAEWVEADEGDEREALLYGVADVLHRARASAAAAIPTAPMDSFTRLAQLVEYLRDDLHLGIAVADVVGPASYAARIEQALKSTVDEWERAEQEASRSKMTRKQQVAGMPERLGRERP